jgi:hypothetical protein
MPAGVLISELRFEFGENGNVVGILFQRVDAVKVSFKRPSGITMRAFLAWVNSDLSLVSSEEQIRPEEIEVH